MADFPFWDEVCLRGSIDQAPLPAPPRSLFDRDLFCDQNGVDDFPDILPPLSPSPQLSTPLRDLPPLPAYSLSQGPSPTPPSHSSSSHQTPPFNLPSIQTALPHTPKQTQSQKHDPTANTPSSRQWRSFLDDSCPLRKRVKVTIIPTVRKRELELSSVPRALMDSPPLKKPRHSQSRVTAPRRMQTTFRVPKPGDPSSRLTLCLSSPARSRHRSLSGSIITSAQGHGIVQKLFRAPVCLPSHEEDADLNVSLDNALEDPISLDALLQREDALREETLRREAAQEAATQGDKESVKIEALEQELQDEEAENGLPRPVQMKIAHPVAKNRSYISSALSARISSMTTNLYATSNVHVHEQMPAKTRTYSSLPLVDAAVQAVSRAARAYSDTLASVVSPVAASAVATIVMARPAPSRVSKKRKSRRRRTLLSFDDREVKPLEEEAGKTPGSPLTRYLNCPSPCAKRTKVC